MPCKDAPEPKTILPQNDNRIDALFDEAVESLRRHDTLVNNALKDLETRIMTNLDCELGNHDFKPFRQGTVKCSKCGKFAKVGYMTRKEQNND